MPTNFWVAFLVRVREQYSGDRGSAAESLFYICRF